MSRNPLELLKQVVTPQVLNGADAALASKATLLDEFYPLLLTIFAKNPGRVKQIVQASGSDSIATLMGNQKADLTSVLNNVSHQHNIPLSSLESLLQSAIPLSAKAVENEAPQGDVAAYLNPHSQSIAAKIPAWALPLLGTLGISHAAHASTVPPRPLVREPAQESNFFRKLLPWLALLGLLLLLFLWRSCRHQPEPVVNQTPVAPVAKAPTATTPAALSLTSGTGNELFACRAQAGNSQLSQSISNAVAQVFTGQRACNITTDQAYNSALPGQEKLAEILALIKATPNASLQWTGDQIVINAPDATDITRLVGEVQTLVPTLNVTGAAPLDPAQTVASSIEASRTALSSLEASARPEDVARALNLQIINFATDSAVIPQENREILDQAAKVIQQVPNVALSVEGYTDSTGNAGHNKTLSEQRAQSVVDYLVSKGVSQDKLQPVGYGSDNPVADNVTEQGKFRNRRIEFKVTNTQTGDSELVNENTAMTSTPEPVTQP